jgi:hypothetical protein
MIRVLLDGLGESNTAATELATKAIIEEINYARRQVSRWIYGEYRKVAEALGFERIPRVRFDDMALRDEIQMMSMVQGMIDRRIISYYTGQKKLGFDPEFEVSQMGKEKDLVEDGTLGIIGSPFQQSRGGGSGDSVQKEQRTPKGTPSEGRPKGKPAPTPKKDPSKGDSSNQVAASTEIANFMQALTVDELEALLKLKKEQADEESKQKKKTRKRKPSPKGK